MKIHEISLGETSFEAIRQAKMTALYLSLQCNARDLRVGDILHLQNFNAQKWLMAKVSHVLRYGDLSGIPKDWALVSFHPIWTEEWGTPELVEAQEEPKFQVGDLIRVKNETTKWLVVRTNAGEPTQVALAVDIEDPEEWEKV